MRHLTTVLLAYVILVPFGVSAVVQDGAGASGSASESEPSGDHTVDATPEARAQAMVARWQDLVTELEGSVRDADEDALQEMRGPVAGLFHEMIFHVATGHEELLARVLRLSDLVAPPLWQENRFITPRIAPFASGRSLHVARQLWPAVIEDLDQFGAAGAKLRRELRDLDRRAEELREEATKARTKKRFVAPNRQGSHEIRYPPPAEAAGVEAVVQIRYLVDDDGLPFIPEILNRKVPSSLLLAGMRAALTARYEPAMVGTRLVPAEESIAVRFENR